MTVRILAAALAALIVITGCGQKGDLYLPDERDRPAEPGSRPANS